jgi:hypothetical protein
LQAKYFFLEQVSNAERDAEQQTHHQLLSFWIPTNGIDYVGSLEIRRGRTCDERPLIARKKSLSKILVFRRLRGPFTICACCLRGRGKCAKKGIRPKSYVRIWRKPFDGRYEHSDLLGIVVEPEERHVHPVPLI